MFVEHVAAKGETELLNGLVNLVNSLILVNFVCFHGHMQMELFLNIYREFLILCNRHLQMGVTFVGKPEIIYPGPDFQMLSLT